MDSDLVAEARTPEGRLVRIESPRWRHVLEGHPDMFGYLDQTVTAIEHPEYREPDLVPGRERFFRRGGPERWIRVVVEIVGDVDRLVTAFPQSNDPAGWRP